MKFPLTGRQQKAVVQVVFLLNTCCIGLYVTIAFTATLFLGIPQSQDHSSTTPYSQENPKPSIISEKNDVYAATASTAQYYIRPEVDRQGQKYFYHKYQLW